MNNQEALDKVDIEGFKRTRGNKKYKNRKLSRIEEDGSKTIVYTMVVLLFLFLFLSNYLQNVQYHLNSILFYFEFH